jgi:hypothetical protein
VSLLALHWHLCRPCAGVFALVALSSLSSFCLLVSPLLLRLHCHPHCNGIVALVALASLPKFCTGINHPHCAGVFTIVLLALSPKAHIALVAFPLFHWCCTIVVLFVLINSISMLKHFVHV